MSLNPISSQSLPVLFIYLFESWTNMERRLGLGFYGDISILVGEMVIFE